MTELNYNQRERMLELCDLLRVGAAADIWYEHFGPPEDDTYTDRIEETKDAMYEAASFLEDLASA